MLLLWSVVALVAALALLALRGRRRGRALRALHARLSCGWRYFPLVGNALQFLGTDEDRMNALIRLGDAALQNGGVCTIWLGPKLYAVVSEPAALAQVARTCLEKDHTTMRYLRLVLGNGIIFAPCNIWRPRRKVMAPTFSSRNLQQFVSVFDKQSAIMADQLGARAGQGDFEFWNYVTTYTFDAVCETVLGVELNAQKEGHHPFLAAFSVCARCLARRMLSPWLYWDWLYRLTSHYKPFMDTRQTIFDFCHQTIDAKRKELAEMQETEDDGVERVKTFLELMIESSGSVRGYSDEELREECLSLVSAGTDTSAVGVGFAAVMLSRHPSVQDKVYQELREVLGDSERAVTWQDLPRLQYLELVVKEALRLYPPVPITVRDVHEPVTLPNGAVLQPGMALVLHLWSLHRSPACWGADADQFRPERFLQPLRHPAQFAPFSYSLRSCLGGNYAMMSAKTALATLVRRYELLPPAALPRDQLRSPLRVQFDVMMKPCDNFRLRIQRRHEAKSS